MPPVVAAVAVGVAAGVAASSVVVGVAMAIGTIALSQSLKPETPSFEESADQAQTLSTTSTAPRRGIYGETVVSGPIIGYGKKRSGDDLYHVVAVFIAGHPCQQGRLYKINDKDPSEVGATVKFYLGDQTTADPSLKQYVDGWTSQHIGRGITYAVVTIPIDDEKLPQGLRNITFKMKGKKVYDPRQDPTFGGSGAHNADDPSTWDWTDNPILCAFDFMRHHGARPQPLSRFDLADIAANANLCDEAVTHTEDSGDTTGPRYSCNGTWTFDEGPAEVLTAILSSCAGKPYRRAGKIHLQAGAYAGPAVLTLTTDDLAGRVRYRPNTPERERCNTVRATYIDPEAEYVSTESEVITDPEYQAQDGQRMEHELRLRFTASAIQAQRLQKQYLERNRAGFMVEMTAGPRGLQAQPGTTVWLDLAEDGISGEFLVVDWKFNASRKTVDLVLQIEYPAIYADAIHAKVPRPEFTIPDNTIIDPPSGLTFTPTPEDNSRQGTLAWAHPAPHNVERYQIRVYDDPQPLEEGDEVLRAEYSVAGTALREHPINGLPNGTYRLAVAAISKHGRETIEVNVPAEIAPPEKPTAITATPGNFHIDLEPQSPGRNHFVQYQVRGGNSANFNSASPIGTGLKVTDNGLPPDTPRYYWARAIGPFGESDWYGPIQTATTKDATELVETLAGAITETAFAQSLASRIDLIDTTHIDGMAGGILSQLLDESGNSRIVLLQQADEALAQQYTEISLKVGDGYAAAIDAAKTYTDTETGKLTAERVIKVDANGVVAGFGILADEEAGSVMYFTAEQIAYLPSNYDPNAEGADLATDAQYAPYYFKDGTLYLAASRIDRLTVNQIEGIDSLDLESGIIEERHLAQSLRELLYFRSLEAETIEGGGSSIQRSSATSTSTTLTTEAITSAGQPITISAKFVITRTGTTKPTATPYVTYQIRDVDSGQLIDLNGSTQATATGYSTFEFEQGLGWGDFGLSVTHTYQVARPLGSAYRFAIEIVDLVDNGEAMSLTFSVSEPVSAVEVGEGEPIDWSRIIGAPANILTATKNGGSYWGFLNPDGEDTGWMRTTQAGLLPYQSGGSGQVGTAAWPFQRGYFNELFLGGSSLDALYMPKGQTEFTTVVSSGGKIGSKSGDLQLQRAGATKLTLTDTGATVTGTLMGTVDLGIGSDRRLKTEIEVLRDAKTILRKLHGYRYRRLDANNAPQVGLIAQEVAKALPEATGLREDGYLAVFYQQITAVLVQAFNELADELEQIRSRSNGN